MKEIFLIMEICNIVSSSTIPIPIDINQIHQNSGDKAYANICPSVNIKLHTSDLCQIFANNKMIVIGGRTVSENSKQFEEYIELLHYLGYRFADSILTVTNIVTRYVHSGPINLFLFAKAKKSLVRYEPEIFPAVRYRIENLKITVNIFHTGRCMVLGAKNLEDLTRASACLRNLLEWHP